MNRFWLAAQVCLLGFVGTAFAAPFQNGGFESGALTGDPCNISLSNGSIAIPGWEVISGDVDYLTPTCWTPSEGSRSLDLVGTGSIGGVRQIFDTIPGQTYQVIFDLAGNPSTLFPPAVKNLTVTAAGSPHSYTYDTSFKTPTNMGWMANSFLFVAGSTSTTIDFVSDMTGSTFAGAALDNVRVARVSPIVDTWSGSPATVYSGFRPSWVTPTAPPSVSPLSPTVCSGPGANWSAAGGSPPSYPLTVSSNGTQGTVIASYNVPNHANNGACGSWTTTATANSSGDVNVLWDYRGDHSSFHTSVDLQAFVIRGGSVVQSDYVVSGRDGTKFQFSGSYAFHVQAGDTYGFTMTGSNADFADALRATLTAVVIAPAPPGVPTTTLLQSSLNPSTVGSSVTLTAAVSGNSPTGTVQFTDGGSTISDCSAPVPLSGGGNNPTAQCTTSNLSVGSHSLNAYYGGDSGNFSSQNQLTQVVNGGSSSTPWTGSAGSVTNPGNEVLPGTPPPYPGTPIGSSPTVVSDGTAGTPAVFTYETVNSFCCHTGDWTFETIASAPGDVTVNWTYDGYHGTCKAQASLTAYVIHGGLLSYSATLYSAYDAACNYALPAGGFGQYGQALFPALVPGDTYGFKMHAGNYDGNGEVTGRLTVTTGASPTTTTLTSFPNPVVSGLNAHFEAIVAGNAPTGTVTFTQDGRLIQGCEAIPVSALLAVCSTSSLAPGSRNIVALYSGDTVNAGGVSNTLVQMVNILTIDSTADTPDAVPGDNICADSLGRCTLRAAVMEANAAIGPGVVITVPPGTYTLTSGPLDVTNTMIIQGAGAATIVDGGGNGRVFNSNSNGGPVAIIGLTVRNGVTVDSGGSGAGIVNFGTLELRQVNVSGNTSTNADGGGIFNLGTLNVIESTVSGNAGGGGAGIFSLNGTVTLTNSTVSGNHSIGVSNCTYGGGGLLISGGEATITSSTIYANFAECTGGSAAGRGHAISSQNAALVTVQNSILSSPGRGPSACYGTVITLDNNIADDTSCGVSGGDLIGVNPQLGALADNGGPTPTHLPNSGSPVIDHVPVASCAVPNDQRGIGRPHGPNCDIGAVEGSASTPPPPALAPPTLVLVVATSSNEAAVIGRADGVPNGSVTFNVYSGSSCNAGALVGGNSVGTFTVPTDDTGVFGVSVANVNSGDFVAVQLTSPSTSAMSACAVSSGDNDFWPKALQVVDGSTSPRDFIDASGKSRWYKFSVTPGQKITVTLSGLADYDLAVFKDINKAFIDQLVPDGTAALTKLSAEFAPSTFSPSTFSPSTFSPSTFSPDAYAPSTFSPSTFSPSLYSPSTFSPSTFSPSTFSPSTFSPSTFSPSTFSPSTFSPSTFSPSTFSPATVLSLNQTDVAQAFSSAQTRTLVAVSATPGSGNESAGVNTWNDTGDFYVRVSGRGSAFSTTGEFTLSVVKSATTCGLVTNPPPGMGAASHPAVIGPSGRQTVILTDSTRVTGDPVVFVAKLAALAGHPAVAGVVVDLKNDARVLAYRAQAIAHADCPYASNLLAQEIKGVVDQYRAANPGLRYVVIAGNDSVVPYFRYPDESLLGEESAYVPPVRNGTASDASLTQDFVLSQDAYGSSTSISMRGIDFPIPGLAVGRLVETSTEMGAVIDAFLGLANGSVVPGTSLVTGYDFLADAAGAVSTELQTGTGAVPQALITANGVSPQSASSWTATQLKSALLGSRHDVIFLAGHFSANSALAADFTTSMLTTDLAASTTDFRNTIVFSAGCHSGYNIVDSDAIDGVTLKLDWPQAFAQKGATLVAGTGYQYGDTEFIEYSERLYQNFARQLRAGTSGSAVTVGEALVRAKLDYLAATPEIRGIHQKALLEATVFGLPMVGVNMPTGRDPNAATPGVIDTSLPSTLAAGPAGTLGLRIAPLSFAPSLSPSSLCLKNPPYDAGSPGVPPPPCSAAYTTASWLTGPNGVTSNPAEPVLPLQIVNVTPTTAVVLRGVGFVGGSYTESTVVPLTGAPTTELRGVHTPFLSPVFFPMRLSTPNYFGALSGSGGTKLLVTPVQHRAADVAAGTSTRRAFTNLDLRLYYSGNTTTTALSAAPTIVGVTAVTDNSGVTFSAQVIGDPAAAIHDVWVTYTSDGSGTWTSLSLAQCSATSPPAACGTTTDSQRWMAHLPPQTATLKYIVQAVNGIGLVSADDNLGAYYSAGGTSGQTLPEGGTTAVATTLTLGSSLGGATYGDTIPVTATLSAGTTPTAGKIVTFTLGSASQSGVTNASGSVTINLPVSTLPGGNFLLKASFAGDQDLVTSSATSGAITVNKASSSLASLAPLGATLTGTIGGKSQPIDGSVKFTLTSPTRGATTVWAVADYLGRATLPPPGMLAGVYMVTSASFAGNAIYQPATLTLAQTITVPKANQTITFGPVSPKTAGDPNFTIAATATSLLPVSFVASGACTISGATVHLTGVGSCTITGSVAATNDFNAATGVLSFSILPAGTATVLTADKTSPVSFGTTINLTATMTPATATGTVTFLDGSTTLGTATAPAAGTTAKAVFAVSSLSIGAHSLTAVYAGNVSLAGSTSAPLSIVIKESFTVANPMLQPRVSHTATLLNDGRVLIAGGSGSGDDDTRASRTAEIYCPNPYTPPAAPVRTLAQWCPNGVGKFSQAGRGNTNQVGIGNLVQARTYHTATLLPNGTVLLVGGYDGSGVSSATAEIYDPTDPIADKFTAAASLPGNAAAGHTATVVTKSGKTYVLVIGGGSAKSWLFDVVAKTWAASGNMASVRSNHTATLIGTKVFVAGGALLLQSLQSTAIYDIATGTFANGPTMLAARELHTATPIANGKVLLAGGRGGGLVNSVALTPLAEIYDPANAATPFVASTLASGTGRFGHSASALSTVGGLPDGRVLVAGGGINILCGQQLATSELYAAGSFTVNATLAAKRVRHTATVLKDGRVLIAGGRGTSGNNCGPLNTTEIWTGQLSP